MPDLFSILDKVMKDAAVEGRAFDLICIKAGFVVRI